MLKNWLLGLFLLAAAGCVTINVYFPAAAAEQAADKIIEQVWKDPAAKPADKPADTPAEDKPADQPADKPSEKPADKQSQKTSGWLETLAGTMLDSLIPAAQAQADFTVSTPAIKAIEARMAGRHAQLQPFYASGAVGLTSDGLIAVRAASAAPLAARGKIAQLVTQENQDRNALYREIANANGHPEWESEIQDTFAKRWIQKAQAGWWHESGGTWRQK
jgi:uncharacterized protein YdbL (DUF1318 family)